MTVQQFYDYCKKHNCLGYTMIVTDEVRFCKEVEFEGYWHSNTSIDNEHGVIKITT